MAKYVWACKDCETEVEVDRAMSEYEKGPEEVCECGGEWYRCIQARTVTRSFRFGKKGCWADGSRPLFNEEDK